jgi:hypothetical protein
VPALLFSTSDDRVITSFVLDMDTKYYASYVYQFVEKKFITEKESSLRKLRSMVHMNIRKFGQASLIMEKFP